MNSLLRRGRVTQVCLGTAFLASIAAVWTIAADHRDGPIFANTPLNGRRDINDIYVFQSPVNPENTVLVLTVSPFAGVNTPTSFDPNVVFDIKVDNDGDAREDITFRTTFGPPDRLTGIQDVTLKRGSRRIAKGKTRENINVRGGGQFRAAPHDDPFFFDGPAFAQLLNGGAFPREPGINTFGPNVNTLAIILEIPSADLNDRADTNIGVWARTIADGRQVDRMGFPALNTAVIPPIPRGSNFPIGATEDRNRQERRIEFNANTRPRRDREMFGTDVVSVLTNFLGRTVEDSTALANFLLPDILPFDTSSAGGFPNGRRLRDDVIDIELGLLTNGAVTTDNVDDDNGTRITDGNSGTTAAFPYLGVPNNPAQGL